MPIRLREAESALGFTRLQTFVNVTLPIGGRIALPSLDQHLHLGVEKCVAASRHRLPGEAHDGGVQHPGPELQDVRDVRGARGRLLAIVALGVDRLVESRLALPEPL